MVRLVWRMREDKLIRTTDLAVELRLTVSVLISLKALSLTKPSVIGTIEFSRHYEPVMSESDSHFPVLRRLRQNVLPKAGLSERRFGSLNLLRSSKAHS
jgi:hypothetical protein